MSFPPLSFTCRCFLRVLADGNGSVFNFLFLNSSHNTYDCAFRTGNCTFDCDEIVLSINFNNFKVLNGSSFNTEVARKFGAFEYAAGVGAVTHGTDVAVDRANTVGCAHTFETITFGGTSVSVTFGFCGNVNFFANFKSVCFDDVANVYCGTIVKSEFTKEFFCSNICFSKMSFKGFGEMFFSDLAVADLYGFITVVFSGFFLNNNAGTGFNYSYRNNFSCLFKKLGRTNLLADDCLFHFFCLLMVIGRFRSFWRIDMTCMGESQIRI